MNVLERLRSRANGVDQFYGSTDEDLDRDAIAEIVRLRAALQEIATYFDSEPGQDSVQTKMARDALSGHQQLPTGEPK